MEDISLEVKKIQEFFDDNSWSSFSLVSETMPSADQEVNLKLISTSEQISELVLTIKTNLLSADKTSCQEKIQECLISLLENIRSFRILFLMSQAGKISEESQNFLRLEKTTMATSDHLDNIFQLLKSRASGRN